MTVTYLGSGVYVGLDADTKPTNVPTNTIFIETDTGEISKYNGSSWDLVNGRTKSETLTGKTIDVKDNTVSNAGIYLFTVFKSGSTYYLRNNETGAIVTSNTSALTVLQAAIDNCSSNSGSTCLVKRGTYLLSAKLDCIDKNFRLHGEGALLSGNVGITNSDTVLKANYTGGAGTGLIDCTNTVYNRQQFANLVIDCNSTVPYGIKAYDVRERYPWLYNVAVVNASDVGIRASKVVYTTCYNVVVAACTNIGVQLYDAGGGVMPNTMYWYGGRFTSNGINLEVDSSTDLAFNQVVMESGVTNNVLISSNNAKQIRFRDCSFEWHPVTTTNISVDDSGVNTTYDNCRFDSNNTTFYPITVRAAARQVQILNGKFQANNGSTTAIITIESGAQDTVLIGNQQNTNTPMTVTLTDNGTRTVTFGNSFDNVKFTGLTDIITLKDSTTNNAGDILVNNATRFTRKARGSANQFVKVNAAGNDTGFEALDVTLDTNALTTSNTKTVTNKTVNLTNNTVTDTSTSAGDLAKSDGTKFTRFARGTLYGQVPRVNSGQTDIEYARQSVFCSSNLYGTWGRKWGLYTGGGGTATGLNLLNGLAVVTGGPAVAFGTITYADKSRPLRWTQTGGVIGNKSGMKTSTSQTYRGWNPRLKCRFRLNNNADSIFKFGFNSTGGDYTAGDDPFNAVQGIAFGKITTATNANWVMMSNDGTGATTITNVGPSFSAVAADNNIHTIEIIADDTNSKWKFSFDEGSYQDLTDAPTQQQVLGFCFQLEATNTTNPTFDVWWIEMESD